jgi:hydrogenase-4 component F
MPTLILFLPFLGGVVCLAAGWRPWAAWTAVAANAAMLAAGIALSIHVIRHGPDVALWGVLRADALSAFMVVVIGAIAVLTSWLGVRTIAAELESGHGTERRATLYAVLVQIFVTTMALAVLAANLGVLWVGVEATTVATTFLVGHHRTRGSLEASWKYIVICSVGIALAFLGTVLIYLATIHAGGHSAHALDWTSLIANAHHLDPSVMRLAFALILLGYGTKVGLAPMHSWLPDAHSQAPAPISALMSGVLLTVAFYAILRCKAICDLVVGPGFARTLLVIAALLSLVVAASLLLNQRDYKRMLAYSSIEHMGLITLGAAAGTPLAIAAVLLHVLGHGLAKATLFLTTGEIIAAEGTSHMDGVRALLARRPALGGIFGVGLLALLGFPPFSLFASELGMIRAEFDVGLGWAAGAAVVAMLVILVAVVGNTRHMLLGGSRTSPPDSTPRVALAPLVAGLTVCAAIGVFAWPLTSLLESAAHAVAL